MFWWAAACSAPSPDAARRAWLVEALGEDDRVWEGRWDELAAKYEAMAADPYDWMRGSLGIFVRDLSRVSPDRSPTAFLERPDSAALLLVGDPHPENLGTFLPGEGPGPVDGPVPLRLEWADLDAAAFGPWVSDVRRAALGLAVLLDGAGERAAVPAATEAMVRAYLAVLDDPGAAFPADPVTEDLFADAARDGSARRELTEATEVTAEGRRFRLGDELVAPDLEQRAQLDRLTAAMPRPEGFRVLDGALRVGVGIASLPALRYVVVWDRGGEGDEDDELLELREVVDPPRYPARDPVTFEDAADRVTFAARTLWSLPSADARAAGVVDGAQGFKVSTWSAFQDTYSHVGAARDLAGAPDDALAFARTVGAALGGAHARSVTASGVPGREALLAELRGRGEAFVAERLRDAEPDLERTLADHALFESALVEFGPLLGAAGR